MFSLSVADETLTVCLNADSHGQPVDKQLVDVTDLIVHRQQLHDESQAGMSGAEVKRLPELSLLKLGPRRARLHRQR